MKTPAELVSRSMLAVLSLLFCCLCALSAAAEEGKLDLTELNLEDLMKITVRSTTKSSLTISKAPGVVRVFTADDFERFGLETLRDVLATLPGVQIQEYRAGHQVAWFRGVQSRYNSKVLLLIDGVPLRDSYYNHFSLDEALALRHIESIEVINGPGSVLYGANGFSGVVSVTTKSKGRSIAGSFKSRTTRNLSVEGDLSNVYGYADYFDSDGFQPELNSDGEQWTHVQRADRSYGFLKYSGDSFEVIGSYTDYEYADRYRRSEQDYYWTRRPTYAALRFAKDLSESTELNVLAYVNYYPLRREKNKFEAVGLLEERERERNDTSLYGADVDLHYSLGAHEITLGTAVQADKAEDSFNQMIFPEVEEPQDNLTDPGTRRTDIGVFLQDVWQVSQTTALVAGVRYDILSDFDEELSFRSGVTTTKDNLYAKLLFGTAYRVPSYREYLDIESFNDSLEAEHLRTIEAQIGYGLANLDVNLTFYHNIYDDYITELFVNEIDRGGEIVELGDEYSVNANERSITGVELYSVYHPNQRLSVRGSVGVILRAKEELGGVDAEIVSTQVPVETGELDIPYLSDVTFNLLAAYTFLSSYTVGANILYFSDRDTPTAYQADVADENKDPGNTAAFARLDLHARAALGDGWDLGVEVENFFDEEIFSPPFGGDFNYDSEWKGRVWGVKLSKRF